MWPIDRPAKWVGRERELAVLRAAVQGLSRGQGSLFWVEGEPGIGKSSLVAEALAETSAQRWDIGWGVADELTERLPLRVMLDCLEVRAGSPDRRRAQAAELLRGQRAGLFANGDGPAAGVEVLVALANELCAAAPVVMMIDDVQWADEASLLVWHELAASIDQLRLLLIGTCRLSARRPEVQRVRSAVTRRGGQVLALEPLAETDVAALVRGMLGSPPGDVLRRLTAQAAGNPLYVRELVDALIREGALGATDAAEISVAAERVPASLAVVLMDRLGSVPGVTEQMLRMAALLGGRFAVTDLAVLLRRPASDLTAGLQEAVTAGILVSSGPELAFRHPLIQQALYESMPTAVRSALHAEAAQALAAASADALTVAQQLFSAELPGGDWARKWLIRVAPALTTRAPRLAAELLQREVSAMPAGQPAPGELMVRLLRALLAAGSYPDAIRLAVRALRTMTDPGQRAEAYWVLIRAQDGTGRVGDAVVTARQALASAELPRTWQARLLAMLSMLERAATGDLDAADSSARLALAAGREAGDAFATAHALTDLWLIHSVRRDHAAALGCVDQALSVLGEDASHADLRSFALDGRIFTLENLDRWPEAELTLRQAREVAQRSGSPDGATWAVAAVLRYWLGQWDDALAELGPDEQDAAGLTYSFLRERWSALLVHGVAALIAGRRDQRSVASQQLRRGLALQVHALPDRENQDFLVAAHAVSLEQGGDIPQAVRVLAAILPRHDGEMTLIHQWLPDLVRLAITAGDSQVAQAAAQACQAEAAAETQPARAAAASLRCQGLLMSDPGLLQEAVTHYRAVGPAAELPAALEDLAVVLASSGQESAARAALSEATGRYESFGAAWDIRRAEGRLRPYGIRRGVRSLRTERGTVGWAALTPTEIKIAGLVAAGMSNPEIASQLFLSRNTVQSHVSHILAKLGAKGRVEIVREALSHGLSALTPVFRGPAGQATP
jgi:DNA-binding CsgD family transcriptional regulator/tetratricopeptide (TPR) repeat protein